MATRDLTGERHGDLVVLGVSENRYVSPKGESYRLCKVKCNRCGTVKEMVSSQFYQCVTCGCGMKRHTRICAICGKEFECEPSNPKQSCSRKCGAQLRKRNGKSLPKGTRPSEKAFEAQNNSPIVQQHRLEWGKTAHILSHAVPEGQCGPQNRTAKKWVLIDPIGSRYEVVSLKDWARRNCRKFFDEDVPEDIAARRVRGGFTAIASSLRGVPSRRSRPTYTYKGWRLEELPVEKTEEDVKMALEENRRQNGEEKEKS